MGNLFKTTINILILIIICAILSFIDLIYQFVLDINGYKPDIPLLLIIDIILVAIYLTYKNIKTQKNTQKTFLENHRNIINENIKNNRRIDWGIEKEPNWKNTWNPINPKETNILSKAITLTIKNILLFLLLTILLFLLTTFVQAHIIVFMMKYL